MFPDAPAGSRTPPSSQAKLVRWASPAAGAAQDEVVRELDFTELDGKVTAARDFAGATLASGDSSAAASHRAFVGGLTREAGAPRGTGKGEFATAENQVVGLRPFTSESVGPLQPAPTGQAVFVGGLSADTTEEDLRALFGQVSKVQDASLITDRETGLQSGTAKVEFANVEDKKKAIRELQGAELRGQTITVREFSYSEVAQNLRTGGYPVYVLGLPSDTTATTVAAHFKGCGEIQECLIILEQRTGRSMGGAKIVFATEAGQRAAIKLSGSCVDGRAVSVSRFSAPPPSRAATVEAAALEAAPLVPGPHTATPPRRPIRPKPTAKQ